MTEEQAWKAHDALVAIRMKIIKMINRIKNEI